MPTNQRYCCICSNHSNKWIGEKKISLHRFPSDQTIRKVWMQRCRLVRADFKFRSYDSTRLCSDHFVGKSGPTSKHTLPSLFPTKTFKISVSTLDMINYFNTYSASIVGCTWQPDMKGYNSIIQNGDGQSFVFTL